MLIILSKVELDILTDVLDQYLCRDDNDNENIIKTEKLLTKLIKERGRE